MHKKIPKPAKKLKLWGRTADSEGMEQENLNPSPLLTLEDAAAYLRLSPHTLKAKAGRGLVPTTRLGGKRFFTQSQLDEFIAASAVPAKAPADAPTGASARQKAKRGARK